MKIENGQVMVPLSVLVNLASLAVHLREGQSPTGHAYDFVSIEANLTAPGVKECLDELDVIGLLPKTR